MALGSALIHSVRGRDGEGAGILHEAIGVADRIGAPESAAQAHRELGYVDLLRTLRPRPAVVTDSNDAGR